MQAPAHTLHYGHVSDGPAFDTWISEGTGCANHGRMMHDYFSDGSWHAMMVWYNPPYIVTSKASSAGKWSKRSATLIWRHCSRRGARGAVTDGPGAEGRGVHAVPRCLCVGWHRFSRGSESSSCFWLRATRVMTHCDATSAFYHHVARRFCLAALFQHEDARHQAVLCRGLRPHPLCGDNAMRSGVLLTASCASMTRR